MEKQSMVEVIESDSYPGHRSDGKRWYSLNVHWWDGSTILGPVRGKPGGNADIWATGNDFAGAVANAIRYIESRNHSVDQIMVNV